MEEKKFKTAEKAVLITTVLTILIAGTEVFNALGYYKTGMNFPDIASYVQANQWLFGLTFIFVNLVMLPGALLLYKESGIDLKAEIYDKSSLGGDILLGIILMIVAALIDLLFLPLYNAGTSMAYVSEEKMTVGTALLYMVSLVLVSGICKEIYFRGFAKHFCQSVFGEIPALLLFNMLFGLLDWYNMGYSFILGLVCIWGYHKRKHLIVPMIIHGGVNLIGIIYALLVQ